MPFIINSKLTNKFICVSAFSSLAVLCSFSSFAADAETNAQLERATSRLIEVTGQIQSINEELSQQRANLGTLKAELAAQSVESENYRRDLLKELKALRRQNQSLVDSLFGDGANVVTSGGKMSEVKPLRNYDLQTPDGKMFFGEDEYFYIKEADATFDARIDTGAAVSSISAKDITEFERKGKKWYRFTVEANEREIVVEAPYVRTSTIRQSSKDETTKRVVVLLNVKIGDYSTQSEFTLADRTKLQYPLLIGRTLIQDIAVVDVARDHIQEHNKDTFLILSRKDYEAAMEKGKDPNAEYKAKRESMAGKVAYPSDNYGSNLGTNSENALPVVRNKGKEETASNNALNQTKAKANEQAKTKDALKETKEESKSTKDSKNTKEKDINQLDSKENQAKPTKDPKDPKDIKDTKATKDSNNNKDEPAQ